MATFRHGKATTFTIDSVALTTYCDAIDFNLDIDTADSTAFGSNFKTAIAGLPGGKVDVSGYYDATATTGPSAKLTALLLAGANVSAAYCPGGAAAAAGDWTLSAVLVTSYSESSPVGGIVTFKASMIINALPTRHV